MKKSSEFIWILNLQSNQVHRLFIIWSIRRCYRFSAWGDRPSSMASTWSEWRLRVLSLIWFVDSLTVWDTGWTWHIHWACLHRLHIVSHHLCLIAFIFYMNGIIRWAIVVEIVLASIEWWLVGSLLVELGAVVAACSKRLMLLERRSTCASLVTLGAKADLAGVDCVESCPFDVQVAVDRPRVGHSRRLSNEGLGAVCGIKRLLMLFLIALKYDGPQFIFKLNDLLIDLISLALRYSTLLFPVALLLFTLSDFFSLLLNLLFQFLIFQREAFDLLI